jgi:Ribbon-helix-helix protein, copG family
MTKTSTKVKPKSKKIGRPVEIAAVNFVGVKLPTALLEAIDAWASDHKASRSEAIRELVERGLKRKS